MPRRRRGFTLFEIMAAVLVMGVVFTALAGVNIEGMLAEGLSRRRLEASLLADELLSDLEAQLVAGSFPEVGTSEREVGGFRVTVNVEPFDPSPYLALAEDDDAPAGRSREDEPQSLLAPPRNGEPSLIRSFQVVVSWSEDGGAAWLDGSGEQQVRRTTFAYDAAAVAPFVEGVVGTAEAAGGGSAGDGGEAGSGGDAAGAGGASGTGASGSGSREDAIQRMLEQLRNAR